MALNNLLKVDMPLNKETKPNQTGIINEKRANNLEATQFLQKILHALYFNRLTEQIFLAKDIPEETVKKLSYKNIHPKFNPLIGTLVSWILALEVQRHFCLSYARIPFYERQ